MLRLHPSVPKAVKFALKSDTLPDGTRVPRGCAVAYSAFAYGRDPRLWHNPLVFDPGRFVGKAEPSAFEYPVFNAGPRLCPGQRFALMEVKLVTSALLHAFDFELAEEHAGSYEATLLLPMSPGLVVKLTPRRNETK